MVFMAKRKRVSRRRTVYRAVRSRTGKLTLPIFPIAGILGAPYMTFAIQNAFSGNFTAALGNLKGMVGISSNGQFSSQLLRDNMTPIVVGLLAHKGASMLGVNRILAQSKVPLIRL